MSGTQAIHWTQGLHRALQQRPAEPATVFHGRTRSFAEQADRVARLAGGLRTLGVRAGDRVGILSTNNDRFVETLLAISWADGVFNALDPMQPPNLLAAKLSESETRILLVDDTFAVVVPDLREAWPGLRVVVHLGDRQTAAEMINYEALIDASSPVPDALRGGDQWAGLVHTRGTADSPRTVVHTCDSLLNLAMALGATVPGYTAPGTRLLQVTPMAHSSGIGSVLAQSHFGGTVVALPRFDPEAVLESIDEHAVTALFLLPSMLQRLVTHPDVARRDLSTVHTVLYGISPLTDELLSRIEHTFPNAGCTQIYGTTESLSCTFLSPTDHRHRVRRRSAGRTAVHAEARVVDADDVDVPTGDFGEIVLRGPGLMHGYWRDPEATAIAIRNGWLHTGDIGRLDDDGYLYVFDRLEDMIMVDDVGVLAATVETALRSHPAVASCAVVAVPDERTGERVHAVVVATPGSNPDHDQLAAHCAARLTEHQVPRSWEFAAVLPHSRTGRVLKRALRSPHWAGRERPPRDTRRMVHGGPTTVDATRAR